MHKMDNKFNRRYYEEEEIYPFKTVDKNYKTLDDNLQNKLMLYIFI